MQLLRGIVTASKVIDKDLLKDLDPLNMLGPEKISEITHNSSIEQLSAGVVLFTKGERDQQAVYLLSGQVELSADNNPPLIVKAGSKMARQPLVHHQPRQVTAKALTKVSVLRIDSELLDALLSWNPSSAYEVSDIEQVDDGDWMTVLLQSPLFQRLPAKNIQAVLTRMETRAVRAGDKIVTQGGFDDYYHVVKQGRCAVTRKHPQHGNEVKLAEIGIGQGFGEEALLSGGAKNASVTMMVDGAVMSLNKQDFTRLLAEPLMNFVSFDEMRGRLARGNMLIDVREADEFNQAAIRGAVDVPLSLLRLKSKDLSPKKGYIVYSDKEQRSAAGAFLLAQQNLNVFILRGGLRGAPADEIDSNSDKQEIVEGSAQESSAALDDSPQKQAERAAARQRVEEETVRARAAEQERDQAQGEIARLNAELEAARQQAEAAKKSNAAEVAAREQQQAVHQETEKRHSDEQSAALKQAAEAAQQRADEEIARMKAELEAAQIQAEEEVRRAAELDAARHKAQQDVLKIKKLAQSHFARESKKQEEEEQRRKQELEETKKQAEAEIEQIKIDLEQARQRAESEALKAEEQEAERRRVEEEAARKIEQEHARIQQEIEQREAAEAQRAEQARLAAEREIERTRAELEEARRKTEEENRKFAEAEAARIKSEQEAARIREQALAQQQEEIAAKQRKVEEEARRAEEAEQARLKAEQEAAELAASLEVARQQAQQQAEQQAQKYAATQAALKEAEARAAQSQADEQARQEELRLREVAHEAEQLRIAEQTQQQAEQAIEGMKAELEAARLKTQQESRKVAEAEAVRLAEQEEAARVREQAQAQSAAQIEASQLKIAQEAERAKLAEEARLQAEEEARALKESLQVAEQKAVQESSKVAETKAAIKQAQIDADAARQLLLEKQEEERRRQQETDAQRWQAAEEARQQAEAEIEQMQAALKIANERIEEEAQRSAEMEAARQKADEEALRAKEQERAEFEAQIETAKRKADETTETARMANGAHQQAMEQIARLQADLGAVQQRSAQEADELAEVEAAQEVSKAKADAREQKKVAAAEKLHQQTLQKIALMEQELNAAQQACELNNAKFLAAEKARLTAERERAHVDEESQARQQADIELAQLRAEEESERARIAEQERQKAEEEIKQLKALLAQREAGDSATKKRANTPSYDSWLGDDDSDPFNLMASAAFEGVDSEQIKEHVDVLASKVDREQRKQAEAEAARIVAEEEAERIRQELSTARARKKEVVAKKTQIEGVNAANIDLVWETSSDYWGCPATTGTAAEKGITRERATANGSHIEMQSAEQFAELPTAAEQQQPVVADAGAAPRKKSSAAWIGLGVAGLVLAVAGYLYTSGLLLEPTENGVPPASIPLVTPSVSAVSPPAVEERLSPPATKVDDGEESLANAAVVRAARKRVTAEAERAHQHLLLSQQKKAAVTVETESLATLPTPESAPQFVSKPAPKAQLKPELALPPPRQATQAPAKGARRLSVDDHTLEQVLKAERTWEEDDPDTAERSAKVINKLIDNQF
ncbi:MAG: cyclic nucleotide-binding domain-containing protein [Gammaproteobacteria bacterium]|nr:cyclic nucleotide-binding domain-containing protein [Gammaproteobacteria bacterium]